MRLGSINIALQIEYLLQSLNQIFFIHLFLYILIWSVQMQNGFVIKDTHQNCAPRYPVSSAVAWRSVYLSRHCVDQRSRPCHAKPLPGDRIWQTGKYRVNLPFQLAASIQSQSDSVSYTRFSPPWSLLWDFSTVFRNWVSGTGRVSMKITTMKTTLTSACPVWSFYTFCWILTPCQNGVLKECSSIYNIN